MCFSLLTVGLVLLTACSPVELRPTQPAVADADPAAVPVSPSAMPTRESGAEPTTVVEDETSSGGSRVTVEVAVTEEPDMLDVAASPESETTPAEMTSETDTATVTEVSMPKPSEEQRQLLANLPVLGRPAELNNEVWFNSEPLKLADLQGNVVIVEFWTFG